MLSAAQQPRAPLPPLLVQTGAAEWMQPLAVYSTTALHAVLPGFFAGRWASILVAAVNVALIYLVAWRVFSHIVPALAAALVLALMPAHMMYGRTGIDAIFIVPFVLAWLYALLGFIENDRPSAIAAASAALGAGVYANAAAPLTMAFLWLLMIVALWIAGRRKVSTVVTAFSAFVLMLAPLAAWFAVHPEQYPDTYGRWAIHAAHIRSPWDGVLAFLNTNTLGTRASHYWGLLDPSYLFFSTASRPAPMHWIIGPLVVAGAVRCALLFPRTPAMLVLVGAAIAPLAGASFGVPYYLTDALALLPFVALLSGYGVDMARLWMMGGLKSGRRLDTDETPIIAGPATK